MRRIIKSLALLFILAAALGAGLVYLNRVVLPVKARQWAQEAATKAVGRPVTIERIRLHLWHGFVVEGIRVGENPSFGEAPFLRIRKVSGALLLVPLVKHRELIIPALHIEGAALELAQSAEGDWNIQDLWKPRPAPPAGQEPIRFILPKIVLSNTEARVRLRHSSLSLALHDVQGELQLALPARIEGTLQTTFQIATPKETGSPIELSAEASYALSGRQLKAEARTSGPLSGLLPLLAPEIRKPIQDLGGTATVDWKAQGSPEGPILLEAWLEADDFSAAVPQPIRSGWAGEPPPQLQVRGRWEGRVQANLPRFPLPSMKAIEGRPSGWRDVQGTVRLDGLQVGPIPYAQELQDLTGEIEISSDGIRTEGLQAAIPAGPVLHLAGSLTTDESRSFGLRVTSSLRWEQVPALPPALERYRALTQPSGETEVEAVVNGTLKPELAVRSAVTARFRQTTLSLPDGQQIQNAAGSLRWQPDLLTATGVEGHLRDGKFQLEGSMVNFSQPDLDFRVSWKGLSAEAQMTVLSDRVQLHSARGKIGSGDFHAFGEIAGPQANLYAEGSLLLEELGRLWPAAHRALQPHDIRGGVSFRCLLEGDLSKPRECAVDLKLQAPSLQVHGLGLKQIRAALKQENRRFDLDLAQAQYADGTVTVSGACDLEDPRMPWSGQIEVRGMRLEQLASDLKWGVQNVAGELGVLWRGEGQALQWAALAGSGNLQIGGARILELPLLGQFAEFLGLPTLRKIAFHEARGDFQMSDGKVRTEDLQLVSPQATLNIRGEGGFLQGAQSPIHWRILPTLSPELIPEESRLKIGKIIAQGASYLIGEVRITGTWKSPKRRFIAKPVTQILNEQLFNLQDILEELF